MHIHSLDPLHILMVRATFAPHCGAPPDEGTIECIGLDALCLFAEFGAYHNILTPYSITHKFNSFIFKREKFHLTQWYSNPFGLVHNQGIQCNL